MSDSQPPGIYCFSSSIHLQQRTENKLSQNLLFNFLVNKKHKFYLFDSYKSNLD